MSDLSIWKRPTPQEIRISELEEMLAGALAIAKRRGEREDQLIADLAQARDIGSAAHQDDIANTRAGLELVEKLRSQLADERKAHEETKGKLLIAEMYTVDLYAPDNEGPLVAQVKVLRDTLEKIKANWSIYTGAEFMKIIDSALDATKYAHANQVKSCATCRWNCKPSASNRNAWCLDHDRCDWHPDTRSI